MKTTRKGEVLEVTISNIFSGLTIAEFLQQKWRVPKKQLHEWRMNRSVCLNGKPVSLSVVLQEKDRIQLPLFKKSPLPVQPSFRPIEVLMEDDHFIIVNKAPGITTHPNSPADTDTLLHAVAGHMYLNGDIGFLRHVHRLDKDTTGAILFAKHPLSYSNFSYLLEKKEIKRTYVAIVHGFLSQTKGTICLPIGRDRHHSTRRRVSSLGQAAVTHYEVLEVHPKQKLTMIRCRLETGRTHQIRVHFSSIGHPLAGDILYGGKPVVHRPALHSEKMEFIHPFTEEKIQCQASPVDDAFADTYKGRRPRSLFLFKNQSYRDQLRNVDFYLND